MHVQGSSFTEFLVFRGFISEADGRRVDTLVQNRTMPLGKVMVTSGMMSVKAVMQVLGEQARMPNERFGQIAVRLGLVTPEELDAALVRQREWRPHPAEIVRELGLLDDSRWREALLVYTRNLERLAA